MITGEKVILRAINKEDVSELIEIHNDLDIKKQAMFHPFPISLDQDIEWFENITRDKSNRSIYFAIDDKETNNFVGYTSLRNINWINRNCSFGISLLPKMQGKGFGKEATSLVINYAIKNLNLHKVQLEVIADNKTAIELYKNLGFVEEGILREQFYFDGFYFNVILMGRLTDKL
ncbi:MAG: GNAT family N-acetyltransferase [Melioribacteraceae bacterium]|nr:GNAT family N-acetyltransferase [Melioribacteraceae bacterium]